MRVLVAHNRYRSAFPSGENELVERERAALAERGVAVEALITDSDDIAGFGRRERAALALSPIRSSSAKRRFELLCATGRPDVVHLHNPYPLISPAIVDWAHEARVPVVQTVHNVRHTCLPGSFAREGRECRDCDGRRVPWPGVLHACYRDSRPQSAVMAVAQVVHRSTWRSVDRFVAVSDFVADVLRGIGIGPDRITVRANGVPDPGPPTEPEDGSVLFAGRLSADKGLDLLLDLWAEAPPAGLVLRIAGEGDLRDRVESVAGVDPAVEYLGRLTPAGVAEAMRAARLVVVPSRVPEALPTVVLEAFAHGRPVVGTAVGAVPGLVDEAVGTVTRPDGQGLRAALDRVHADATGRGAAARQRYLDHFTEDRALDRLLEVYAEVVTAGGGARR